MKVWNEKALQTSPSLSLVLGFIFVLKESFFAILVVLYQERCGVMRYLVLKGEKPWQKKREKNLCSVNVAVSLTVMGISDLPHKHRLALCELYVMSPPRPVSGHWTARSLMEGPKWDRCHLKWILNKTRTESEKHDSFTNEKDWKWIVSNWGVLAPETHTSHRWTRHFKHWHMYTYSTKHTVKYCPLVQVST